jgi:hypothetical protein
MVILLATVHGVLRNTDSFPAPSEATLARLSVPERIVTIAQSQVGYTTEPSDSYCNKFSAHWVAGTGGCPSGETAEEWCADFATWAWQMAGVQFTYGYGPGEINGAAASFYDWVSPTGSGIQQRTDLSLLRATWRSMDSRSGLTRQPCT